MNLKCPHCGVFVTMEWLAGNSLDGRGYHEIWNCKNCNKKVYFIFEEDKTTGRSQPNYEKRIFQYPWSIPKLHESIPKEVSEDYVEAMKCLGGGSAKGALSMFRRCLQVASRHLGAKPDDLVKEIDELESKGTITKDLKELAHQIRLLGNDGAHPNRPDVSVEEANEIKEFIDNFFNYVYIMHHRVKEMKGKKLKPNKTKK